MKRIRRWVVGELERASSYLLIPMKSYHDPISMLVAWCFHREHATREFAWGQAWSCLVAYQTRIVSSSSNSPCGRRWRGACADYHVKCLMYLKQGIKSNTKGTQNNILLVIFLPPFTPKGNAPKVSCESRQAFPTTSPLHPQI